MKRTVLVLSLFVASMASAQVAEELVPLKTNNFIKENLNYMNSPVKQIPFNDGEATIIDHDFITIGKSFYDLQTNASIGTRILLHGDGTVTTVWTNATSITNGWPNRGTGYNHFDGTNWGVLPTARIEDQRTGWPTIMKRRNGEEFTIAHFSTDGGFIVANNDSKGSNNFTSSAIKLDDVTTSDNRVPIWNRSANTGDTIHLISNYWASTDNNVPVVVRKGISSPTTYSRSFDGGKTWNIEHMMLPGYDSVRYSNGGGDTYAITERDGIVAICIGGTGRDVAIWKSTDHGDNWTHMYADSFTHAPWNGKQFIPADTNSRARTNDGSVDVMIDNNGKIHAFWGTTFVADDDTLTDGYTFWPATGQLRHWVEGTPGSRICGALADYGATGINIAAETFNALDANENIPQNLSFAARYGSTSLVTQPSAGVDSKGNLYVTYSAPVDETIHDFGANFRDIFISYSTDGGMTWNGPQNVTQMFKKEVVFASMAKDVNDFVHIVFQSDATPGTHLQNNGNSGLHPNDEVTIQYAAIPVEDILNDEIGLTGSIEGTDGTNKIFVVSQNYPNPFNESTEVTVYLQKSSSVNLTVTDLTGKVVATQSYDNLNAGNHKLNIDGSSLLAGAYFYTLSTSNYEVTKKMSVIK